MHSLLRTEKDERWKRHGLIFFSPKLKNRPFIFMSLSKNESFIFRKIAAAHFLLCPNDRFYWLLFTTMDLNALKNCWLTILLNEKAILIFCGFCLRFLNIFYIFFFSKFSLYIHLAPEETNRPLPRPQPPTSAVVVPDLRPLSQWPPRRWDLARSANFSITVISADRRSFVLKKIFFKSFVFFEINARTHFKGTGIVQEHKVLTRCSNQWHQLAADHRTCSLASSLILFPQCTVVSPE